MQDSLSARSNLGFLFIYALPNQWWHRPASQRYALILLYHHIISSPRTLGCNFLLFSGLLEPMVFTELLIFFAMNTGECRTQTPQTHIDTHEKWRDFWHCKNHSFSVFVSCLYRKHAYTGALCQATRYAILSLDVRATCMASPSWREGASWISSHGVDQWCLSSTHESMLRHMHLMHKNLMHLIWILTRLLHATNHPVILLNFDDT
jgi:hypothetical protein